MGILCQFVERLAVQGKTYKNKIKTNK